MNKWISTLESTHLNAHFKENENKLCQRKSQYFVFIQPSTQYRELTRLHNPTYTNTIQYNKSYR